MYGERDEEREVDEKVDEKVEDENEVDEKVEVVEKRIVGELVVDEVEKVEGE